jgi:hypothetical protein
MFPFGNAGEFAFSKKIQFSFKNNFFLYVLYFKIIFIKKYIKIIFIPIHRSSDVAGWLMNGTRVPLVMWRKSEKNRDYVNSQLWIKSLS